MDNSAANQSDTRTDGEGAARGSSARQSSPFPQGRESARKSPALAAFLSLIMPGLGQVYIGMYEQGFTHALIVASLIAVLDYGIGAGEPLVGFFLAFYWLFNTLDAHRRAVHYNRAAAGAAALRIPAEGGIAPGHGSLVGGAAMIAAGVLLLAHTRFGYSLRWLEDWWPAALVLVGGYLVWRAVVEGRSRHTGPRARDSF